MRIASRNALIVFAIILFCWQQGAHAQSDTLKARVVLKNGRVIKGTLAEPWTKGPLLLRLSELTVVRIDSADIRRLKQTVAGDGGTDHTYRQKPRREAYAFHTGYFHHVFIGPSIGEDQVNLSMGVVNGYRFSPRYALGMGVNYDRYFQAAALPLYLQGRLYLKQEGVSLYTFADAGYSLAWQNKNEQTLFQRRESRGGLMGQLGLGYQFNYRRSALNFSIGYKLQKMITHHEYFEYRYSHDDGWNNPVLMKYMDLEEKRLIRRMVFTIGMSI